MGTLRHSPQDIYRIENGHGEGPYAGCDFSLSSVHGAHDIEPCEPERPGPHNDPGLAAVWGSLDSRFSRPKFIFGFTSEAQAGHWIGSPEVAAELDAAGFRVVLHTATEWAASEVQAIFNKQTAVRVGTSAPVSSLFA